MRLQSHHSNLAHSSVLTNDDDKPAIISAKVSAVDDVPENPCHTNLVGRHLKHLGPRPDNSWGFITLLFAHSIGPGHLHSTTSQLQGMLEAISVGHSRDEYACPSWLDKRHPAAG